MDIVFEKNFLPKEFVIPRITQLQLEAIHAAAFADAAGMTNDEWLEARKVEGYGGSIGGSSAAAAMGVTPFSDPLTLYFEIVRGKKREMGNKWFLLEYGHAIEPLVAEAFGRAYNAGIINETGMFKHPDYDYIRADMDRLVVLPNGELVILECKTTNHFGKTVWDVEVPPYYETQGRHYLMVMNAILRREKLPIIKRVFFGALFDNNEESVLFRKIDLDAAQEDKMLNAERDFWENHVLKRVPPKVNYTGKKFKDFNLNYRIELAELNEFMGIKTEEAVPALLGDDAQKVYDTLAEYKRKKDELKKQTDELEDSIARCEGELVLALNGAEKGVLPCGMSVELSTRPTRSVNYDLLREVFPDAYTLCVAEKRTKPSLSIKNPPKEKKPAKGKKKAE